MLTLQTFSTSVFSAKPWNDIFRLSHSVINYLQLEKASLGANLGENGNEKECRLRAVQS